MNGLDNRDPLFSSYRSAHMTEGADTRCSDLWSVTGGSGAGHNDTHASAGEGSTITAGSSCG